MANIREKGNKTKRTKKGGGFHFTRFHLPIRLPHPLISHAHPEPRNLNPFPCSKPRAREREGQWLVTAAGDTTAEGVSDETPLYATPDLIKPRKPDQLQQRE